MDNLSNNTGREMTFWSLINEYSICIPIVQRDYVQGRDNEQVIGARQNLLDDMRRVVEDGKLDLNFVYGKVHGDIFIPLDGQQRLTTLFLLHWFAFLKAMDFDKLKVLAKFSYETRVNSRRFIKDLVNEAQSITALPHETPISKQIKDQSWFWMEWLYDPTVHSALIMLDEIEKRFSDVENLVDRLTIGSSISFRFLNMQDLGMEDSLYIKLNARGRQLTDFDKFKAELEKHIKSETIAENIRQDYPEKLDKEWADLFWKWTGQIGKPEEFDKVYMRCFHWALWNRWAATQKEIQPSNKVITDAMNKTEYYRLDEYKKHGAIDSSVLDDLYHALQYYAPDPVGKIAVELFGICEKAKDVTYQERVMLFAVTRYIGRERGFVHPEQFSRWIRIWKNLVRNAYMDGLDIFVGAIQTIAELSEKHTSDLLEYFASPDCPNTFKGFIGYQVEEERLKARLILRSTAWANAIEDAEGHPYFSGQIAFLLNFSGLQLDTIDQADDFALIDCLRKFNIYKKKMLEGLFNEEGLKIDYKLLSRAILSKGDYLLDFKNCKSFLIDEHRDIGWRVLLRKSRSAKRQFLQAILDELDESDLTKTAINKTLTDIIDKANIPVDDWRYYLVKWDNLLAPDFCGKFRLICAVNNRILLVPCQTTTGYNWEYYTYILSQKLKAAGKDVHYESERGQYGSSHINKIDQKPIRIDYRNAEFNILFNGQSLRKKTMEEVLDFCLNLPLMDSPDL